MLQLYQQELFKISGVEYGSTAKILIQFEMDAKQEIENWLTESLNNAVELSKEDEKYVEKAL